MFAFSHWSAHPMSWERLTWKIQRQAHRKETISRGVSIQVDAVRLQFGQRASSTTAFPYVFACRRLQRDRRQVQLALRTPRLLALRGEVAAGIARPGALD